MTPKTGIMVTQRDKVLLMILPAIIILTAYGWFYTKAPNQRIRKLSDQVAAARAKEPKKIELQAEEARGLQKQAELERVTKELAPIKEELERLTAAWTNSTERLVANDALAALFTKHNLVLLEQTMVTNQVKLSPALQELTDKANKNLGPGRYPVLWEVRLQGGFLSMLDALEDLARSDLAAIPMTLEMGDTPTQPGKSWKLRLWQ
jgi:hypothetical protein